MDTVYFIENWKHSNKIIFKYINSIVRSILKEIFDEKKKFMSLIKEQPEKPSQSQNAKKWKKKKEKRKKET